MITRRADIAELGQGASSALRATSERRSLRQIATRASRAALTTGLLSSALTSAQTPTGVFVPAGMLFSTAPNLTSVPLANGSAFVAGAWTGAAFSEDGSWQLAIPFHAFPRYELAWWTIAARTFERERERIESGHEPTLHFPNNLSTQPKGLQE